MVEPNTPANSGLSELRRQLDYVALQVPFYQRLSLGAGRPLEDFPLVTRAEIQHDYGAFLSESFVSIRESLLRSLTQKLPASELMDENGILISETSGTSGLRLRCPRTPADRLAVGIGIWRQRRRIDPCITPHSLHRFTHLRESRLEAPRFDPRNIAPENLQGLYGDVARARSRWIHAQPSMLFSHAEFFLRSSWMPALPDLRFIECTGEFLSPEAIQTLEEAFSTHVVDQYGMMETWAIGLRCSHGVYHVNDHNLHLEILDRQDTPAATGELGQIVVTTLRQKLLPFIRYVTNDYGMWVEPPCGCQLGGRTFALLNGRENELIGGYGRTVFGNTLFARAIKDAHRFYDLDDLRHIRVVQTTAESFTVRTNAIARSEELCRIIRAHASAELGRPIQIEHMVLSERTTQAEARGKPWLFRRAMR